MGNPGTKVFYSFMAMYMSYFITGMKSSDLEKGIPNHDDWKTDSKDINYGWGWSTDRESHQKKNRADPG